MILIPKNWQSFQHYKDRAPAWIKLHKGLLDDFEFTCLPIASKALAPLLWLLASEYEGGRIEASLDKIAFRLRMTRGELADALSPLVESGFFDASEAIADCKHDAMPEKEREVEKETETEKNSRAAPSRAPSRFDDFWKLYPRREGPNPRAPAEKKFDALVKSGVDPEFLIAEVKKFALLDDTRKSIGSRFIPQAVTWLNQQRWADHAAVAFLADEELPRAMTVDQALDQWQRFGRWSMHAPGAAPGEPGCVVTAEQFAAVGLDPAGRKLQLTDAE